MAADQVGEEVTLRRWALRAWVDNAAALLSSRPLQRITNCMLSSELLFAKLISLKYIYM
jgi:hypothetical protein